MPTGGSRFPRRPSRRFATSSIRPTSTSACCTAASTACAIGSRATTHPPRQPIGRSHLRVDGEAPRRCDSLRIEALRVQCLEPAGTSHARQVLRSPQLHSQKRTASRTRTEPGACWLHTLPIAARVAVAQEVTVAKKAARKAATKKTTRTTAKRTAKSTRPAGQRERLNTGRDTRYAKRDAQGQWTEMDDTTRSQRADRARRAKRTVPSGFGDQGDQARRPVKRASKKR